MDFAALMNDKRWSDKISRSGYFLGAVLLHLIIFIMVATLVIFPAFKPPTEDFVKTYLPPPAPPPPPPPSQPMVQVPTHTVSVPTTVITTTAPSISFSVPLPDFTQAAPDKTEVKMTKKAPTTPNTISSGRLSSIMSTESKWGRDSNNIRNSNSDPRNIEAKFPVYLASYANGDWGCNNYSHEGKIDAGSLPNLVAKMNEWSHGHITGEVEPTPLNIGGPELLDKKPPFIFFTGHKDFVLTPQEIQNLQDYLQVGGCIWGDNALAGRGSRFDVAFRREMKRVIPDVDKDFQPIAMTEDVFAKSWFPITKMPQGMNYYTEPMEHIDIDGKLAVIYTLNDYSDMFTMRILPGDTQMMGYRLPKNATSPLFTPEGFLNGRGIFFRNFELPSCLLCDQLGMNIIGYLLVRFDKDLLLAPP